MRHSAILASTRNHKNNAQNRSSSCESSYEEEENLPLPGLNVRLVFGSASVWSAPWGAWSLEAELAQLREKGISLKRDVEVVCVKGGNHFVSTPLVYFCLRFS